MNTAIAITLIICGTFVLLSIIGKVTAAITVKKTAKQMKDLF